MINYFGTVSVSATEAPGLFNSIFTMFNISMLKAQTRTIVLGSFSLWGNIKEYSRS